MRNKNRNKPTILPSPQVEEPPHSPPQLSEEAAESFELELCWCINQLRTALRQGKLNSKQVQDHTKTLNALMSNTAPLIKKRQLMRLSFGDYRKKMADEAKRVGKANHSIKLKPRTPSTKSTFIKKASKDSNVDAEGDFRLISSDNCFKFNFDVSSSSN